MSGKETFQELEGIAKAVCKLVSDEVYDLEFSDLRIHKYTITGVTDLDLTRGVLTHDGELEVQNYDFAGIEPDDVDGFVYMGDQEYGWLRKQVDELVSEVERLQDTAADGLRVKDVTLQNWLPGLYSLNGYEAEVLRRRNVAMLQSDSDDGPVFLTESRYKELLDNEVTLKRLKKVIETTLSVSA